MMLKTHVLFAAPIIAIPFACNIPLDMSIALVSGLLIGSAFPDIDEPNSSVSKRLSFLSTLFFMLKTILQIFSFLFLFGVKEQTKHTIYKALEHRGITHFLLIPLILFCSSFLVSGEARFFLFGVSAGWLMHEIGDMQTRGGIYNWLFPFFIGKRFWVLPRALRYDVGSLGEYIVFFMLFCVNIYLFASVFRQWLIVYSRSLF